MSLNSIEIFLKVVEKGSFSAAARAMQLPNSTVSVKVSQLEDSLGVSLLNRTTRKVSVTETGMQFYKRCVHAMDEINSAREEATHTTKEPSGNLRVTAALDFSQYIMPKLIKRFTDQYPKVTVELIASNQRLDLVAENIDVALRVGKMQDSTLISRRIGDRARVGLYASPDYLSKHKAPEHPRDLAEHEMIGFANRRDNPVELTSGRSKYTVNRRSRVSCDDPQVAKALLIEGMGIGLSTNFHVSTEVEKGILVPVLPDWTYLTVQMSLVYPQQRFLPLRVRRFIDVCAAEIKHVRFSN